MKPWKVAGFLRFWNRLAFLLYLKKVSGHLKKTIALSVFYQLFWKSLQLTTFMDSLLSKYQCGFRKSFSAKTCLLAMLEKWKSSVDKGKVFGVLLNDLSNVFDWLSHEPIIAKSNAHGFSLPALKLMPNYLIERKQRTNINQAYSS